MKAERKLSQTAFFLVNVCTSLSVNHLELDDEIRRELFLKKISRSPIAEKKFDINPIAPGMTDVESAVCEPLSRKLPTIS